MKAVARRKHSLVLDILADPVPAAGQVLVKTLSCGICGSDLHALNHLEHTITVANRGLIHFPDIPPVSLTGEKEVVFGHEFCAEILDHGPGTKRTLPVGTRVCSVPSILTDTGRVETVGYSNIFPGGYAERMVLMEDLLLPVPNGLSSDMAALTEPFAIGIHAVNKAAPERGDVFLVIGCGPVGLSVISALKARGCGPIIASDFSPRRRALAELLGADVLVNPAEMSPYSKWKEFCVPRSGDEFLRASLTGDPARRPVIFECVGLPGMIRNVMEGAPIHSKIIIVGVCMEEDRFEPYLGINKQLDMSFVFGYTPDEFASTLHQIAEGELVAEPIITGTVSLDKVVQAFDELKDPEVHAKIIINPS